MPASDLLRNLARTISGLRNARSASHLTSASEVLAREYPELGPRFGEFLNRGGSEAFADSNHVLRAFAHSPEFTSLGERGAAFTRDFVPSFERPPPRRIQSESVPQEPPALARPEAIRPPQAAEGAPRSGYQERVERDRRMFRTELEGFDPATGEVSYLDAEGAWQPTRRATPRRADDASGPPGGQAGEIIEDAFERGLAGARVRSAQADLNVATQRGRPSSERPQSLDDIVNRANEATESAADRIIEGGRPGGEGAVGDAFRAGQAAGAPGAPPEASVSDLASTIAQHVPGESPVTIDDIATAARRILSEPVTVMERSYSARVLSILEERGIALPAAGTGGVDPLGGIIRRIRFLRAGERRGGTPEIPTSTPDIRGQLERGGGALTQDIGAIEESVNITDPEWQRILSTLPEGQRVRAENVRDMVLRRIRETSDSYNEDTGESIIKLSGIAALTMVGALAPDGVANAAGFEDEDINEMLDVMSGLFSPREAEAGTLRTVGKGIRSLFTSKQKAWANENFVPNLSPALKDVRTGKVLTAGTYSEGMHHPKILKELGIYPDDHASLIAAGDTTQFDRGWMLQSGEFISPKTGDLSKIFPKETKVPRAKIVALGTSLAAGGDVFDFLAPDTAEASEAQAAPFRVPLNRAIHGRGARSAAFQQLEGSLKENYGGLRGAWREFVGRQEIVPPRGDLRAPEDAAARAKYHPDQTRALGPDATSEDLARAFVEHADPRKLRGRTALADWYKFRRDTLLAESIPEGFQAVSAEEYDIAVSGAEYFLKELSPSLAEDWSLYVKNGIRGVKYIPKKDPTNFLINDFLKTYKPGTTMTEEARKAIRLDMRGKSDDAAEIFETLKYSPGVAPIALTMMSTDDPEAARVAEDLFVNYPHDEAFQKLSPEVRSVVIEDTVDEFIERNKISETSLSVGYGERVEFAEARVGPTEALRPPPETEEEIQEARGLKATLPGGFVSRMFGLKQHRSALAALRQEMIDEAKVTYHVTTGLKEREEKGVRPRNIEPGSFEDKVARGLISMAEFAEGFGPLSPKEGPHKMRAEARLLGLQDIAAGGSTGESIARGVGSFAAFPLLYGVYGKVGWLDPKKGAWLAKRVKEGIRGGTVFETYNQLYVRHGEGEKPAFGEGLALGGTIDPIIGALAGPAKFPYRLYKAAKATDVAPGSEAARKAVVEFIGPERAERAILGGGQPNRFVEPRKLLTPWKKTGKRHLKMGDKPLAEQVGPSGAERGLEAKAALADAPSLRAFHERAAKIRVPVIAEMFKSYEAGTVPKVMDDVAARHLLQEGINPATGKTFSGRELTDEAKAAVENIKKGLPPEGAVLDGYIGRIKWTERPPPRAAHPDLTEQLEPIVRAPKKPGDPGWIDITKFRDEIDPLGMTVFTLFDDVTKKMNIFVRAKGRRGGSGNVRLPREERVGGGPYIFQSVDEARGVFNKIDVKTRQGMADEEWFRKIEEFFSAYVPEEGTMIKRGGGT